MKKSLYTVIFLSLHLFISCQNQEKQYNQYLKGKVKRDNIAIAPKVPGRILSIRVNESDVVNKGDTLAVLAIPEVEAKLKQAQGAFQAAKAQYEMAMVGATAFERKQVEAMHQAAVEQFSFADKSYHRLKNMYTDSLIPAQQYDDIYSKYMGAKAQLDAAEARKADVFKGTREERVRMALGDKLRAEGALQEAETAYAERFLVAPDKMSIETIALKEGELALPGYNIFVGYLVNNAYFRFTVSEKKVHTYVHGTEYQLLMPYQEGKTIRARLVGIKQLNSYASLTSVFPEYDLGESVYELKLLPINIEEKGLFTNMTVLMKEK